MYNQFFPVTVNGHLQIKDDLDNVYVNKHNAVHPQNVARVIARALSNESNFKIYRIAFGNGGTQVDSAYTVTFEPVNDGQPPDTRTWDSRIHNETYSEIVDEGQTDSKNPDLGTDPGSAGPNTGTRTGGGADPDNDPESVPHVSGPGVRSSELGLTSEVLITSVLNPNEPKGQFNDDDRSPEGDTETSFTFDEIGLYTPGGPAIDSSGTQDVDVGDRTSTDDTGLKADTKYNFRISVDGGDTQTIEFTTPSEGGSGDGGEILYGDLCEAINTGDEDWNSDWGDESPLPSDAKVSITDNTENFPSITGSQTFGFLRFSSDSTGSDSSIDLEGGSTDDDLFDLFDVDGEGDGLNPPSGTEILTANDGVDAGVQNDPVDPDKERERLLTHLIFSPVLKAANRTLTITYKLTISVARTES